MNSTKNIGRIVGVLFLLLFISGIIVFQFLQGPVLFSKDFLTTTSANSNNIILSILLGILSGIISIVIAAVLFPIFKKYSLSLALLYLAFCILNFIGISIDNMSVLSMLEVSQAYVKNTTGNVDTLKTLGTVFYEKHWWSHYLSLLISCFPVFVLYYILYVTKLVPRIISAVGMIAVVLMFIEILFSILGQGIGMNMLIPIGLIQLILPLWLIVKGFNTVEVDVETA